MPHQTGHYGFAYKVASWVGGFRDGKGFFVCLGANGDVTRVEEADGPRGNWTADRLHALEAECAHWIWYDPFDMPEWFALRWQGVPRAALEALIGQSFTDQDLAPAPGLSEEPMRAIPEDHFAVF